MNRACGALAITIALMSSVSAADLPSRTAPAVFVPPPLPVTTWTGFYVGAQAGYEFGQSSIRAPLVFPTVAYNAEGFIGGGHVGYNYQLGSVVVGIEGDANGATYSGTTLNRFSDTVTKDRSDLDGSIRGRAGFVLNQVLFYATGGAAFGPIRNTFTAPTGLPSFTFEHDRIGYTVGGGVEYLIAPNVSVRGEYRFTDLGEFGAFPGTVTSVRIFRNTDNRVQGGVSYKFDAPLTAPVVARY